MREKIQMSIATAVAIFVAGMIATPVFALAANSIGTREVRDRSLMGRDIMQNSVGSTVIVDRSLVGRDISLNTIGNGVLAPDAVTSNKVKNGSLKGEDFEHWIQFGFVEALDGVKTRGLQYSNEGTTTIVDNGDPSQSEYIITAENTSSSYVEIKCEDVDGCIVALSASATVPGFTDGGYIQLINIGSNSVTIKDDVSSNHLQGNGDYVMGIFDTLQMFFTESGGPSQGNWQRHWVEVGRSDN